MKKECTPVEAVFQQIRRARNMSMPMFAKECEYGPLQVRKFERGLSVITDRFVRIAVKNLRLTQTEQAMLDEARQWRRKEAPAAELRRVVKTLSGHRFDVAAALFDIVRAAPMTRLDEIVKVLRIRL